EWNNWLFSGAIDAGHGGYDANRSIAVAGLTANSQSKFGANHAGLHARIAYNVALSDWYVKPYVDLHAVHIRTGSYSESYAAGLGLNVASSSNTTYSATPMLEAGARWTLGNGMVLRPYAAIGRAFHSNNDWSSSSQLTGANLSVAPMSIGFDAPRQFTRAKAGLNLAITKSSELRIEYSGDFARGYRIREGSLRYSYFF
ncbi:MAG: autotransporter outer membrane beta-barrel domain-containing protein, partial [Burkholderiales bacterium]